MSRIRTIKPEFPQSSTLGGVSRDARLCAVSLLTVADDEGRLAANLRVLAGQLYPFDDDARDLLDGWLTALERIEFIQRYTADGKPYISITGWKKHQKIDRPGQSRLPPPPKRLADLEGVAHDQAPLGGHHDISTSTREDSLNTREGSMGSGETSQKSSDSAPSEQRRLDAGPRTLDQGSGTEDQKEKASRKRVAYPLRPDDVSEQTWNDFLVLRRAKKAPVTLTVLKEATAEAAKASMTLEAFLQVWCARGSQGLQAEWLTPHERGGTTPTTSRHSGFDNLNYEEGINADGTIA